MGRGRVVGSKNKPKPSADSQVGDEVSASQTKTSRANQQRKMTRKAVLSDVEEEQTASRSLSSQFGLEEDEDNQELILPRTRKQKQQVNDRISHKLIASQQAKRRIIVDEDDLSDEEDDEVLYL